ncbi:MAG: hypothetical protein CUN54_08625, partial [Phototrophicales bacterium]
NPDLTVTPDNILYLQRTIGNRAVQQLLKQQRPVISSIPNASFHIQRAWQRVPRRRHDKIRDEIAIGADNTVDRVYAFFLQNKNVSKVFVYKTDDSHLLFQYQNGYFAQIYDNTQITQAHQAITGAVLLVTLQGNARTHILNGEISGNSHVGLHTERFLGANTTVHQRTDADGNGVYGARITLNNNQPNRQPKNSLMFPTSWDEYDIADAVQNAMNTIQPAIHGLRNGYSGPGLNGFRIAMRFSDNNNRSFATLETAFPLEFNGDNLTANDIDNLFN